MVCRRYFEFYIISLELVSSNLEIQDSLVFVGILLHNLIYLSRDVYVLCVIII